MTCTQPGCPGEIVDGYCDTCGMPPEATPVSPTSVAAPTPTPAPRAAPVLGGPCNQPGCPGQIVDGYCDTCGAPAGAAPLAEAPATPPATPRAVGDGSSMTRGSNRIGSTVLGSARAGASRRRISTSTRLRASRIGAGLTRVPPAPEVDPSAVLMTDPQVPESKRTCPQCGTPVGRSRDSKPGRIEGFCPHCRARFSFSPKLNPGDLVAGQYEVQGALAHGGMGWIYLARDKNVSDRWVVLKGLLNSEDPDLVAATLSEQQFLAQVQHPLIVEIYNFVKHDGAAYIVMEYVGGRSIKQLLKQRTKDNHGVYSPLPVDQAIAFLVEILPAFQYLHDLGLVYCDFKPDNLIQVGDAVKLIDLGGVRRLDDEDSAIYGTIGYQAPEVATVGPSVASDLYTIGRSLIVMCAEFKGYQTTYQVTVPSPEEMPLFAEYDSLYRLVLKCCAPDPNDRFQSADELRNQLLGVLREVVGAATPGNATTSAASLLFDPPTVSSDSFDWQQLPKLRLDPTDPQYAFVQGLNLDDPGERLRALNAAPGPSAEVSLAKAHAALEIGEPTLLRDIVTAMLHNDPWEWRAVWMSGMAALLVRDFDTAQSSFNAVYGQVPGELAPKLALAVACEHGHEPEVAETLYTICASTDANYVPAAAFGLARIRSQRGDLSGSLGALEMIPTTSRGYSESRRLRAMHLVRMGQGLGDLQVAMQTVESAKLDEETRGRYRIDVLERALAYIRQHGPNTTVMIGSTPAYEKGLRHQLESAYRTLAHLEGDASTRAALIEKANRTRKWSLL